MVAGRARARLSVVFICNSDAARITLHATRERPLPKGGGLFCAASRPQQATRYTQHAALKDQSGFTTEFTEGGVKRWSSTFPQTRDKPLFCGGLFGQDSGIQDVRRGGLGSPCKHGLLREAGCVVKLSPIVTKVRKPPEALHAFGSGYGSRVACSVMRQCNPGCTQINRWLALLSPSCTSSDP